MVDKTDDIIAKPHFLLFQRFRWIFLFIDHPGQRHVVGKQAQDIVFLIHMKGLEVNGLYLFRTDMAGQTHQVFIAFVIFGVEDHRIDSFFCFQIKFQSIDRFDRGFFTGLLKSHGTGQNIAIDQAKMRISVFFAIRNDRFDRTHR